MPNFIVFIQFTLACGRKGKKEHQKRIMWRLSMFRVALLVSWMILPLRTYYRTNNTNILLSIIINIHIYVLRHLMMIISSSISFYFVLEVFRFPSFFFIPYTTSSPLDECCLRRISLDCLFTEMRLFHSPFDSLELPWCHWTSPLSSPNLSKTQLLLPQLSTIRLPK